MSPFGWYVWIAVILAQLAIAALILAMGFWRRWPSLLCFLVLLSARDLVRLADTLLWRNPSIEFYSYWWASLAAELVEVWLIVQIGLELAGVSPWLRRTIVHGIPCLTSLVLVVLFALAYPLPSYARVGYVVLHLDQAVSLSVLAAFLLGVCLPAEALGLQWSGGVRGIAAAFALEVTASSSHSLLTLVYNLNANLLSHMKSATYLASLAIWGFTAARSRRAVRDESSQVLPAVEYCISICLSAFCGADTDKK